MNQKPLIKMQKVVIDTKIIVSSLIQRGYPNFLSNPNSILIFRKILIP